MSLPLYDRVMETTTTTGTGTITLAGAVSKFQAFTIVGDASQTYYCIVHQTANEWEVGTGTYTFSGTTLSRTTVLAGSSAGANVNFSAGTKDVFLPNAAARGAASTTDVMTGTDAEVLVTPNALASLWVKGTTIASATTITIQSGGYFHVSGTTTITDIDFSVAKNGRPVVLIFDGILILTHHATTLQLPGGANITTAAGDRAWFIQDDNDNITCIFYQRAATTPPTGTNTGDQAAATQAEQETASIFSAFVSPGSQQYHPSAAKAYAVITTSAGVVTTRDTYNVSSVTDNAVGRFTFNLTVPFSSAHYAFGGNCQVTGNVSFLVIDNALPPTTSAASIVTISSSTLTAVDPAKATVAWHGDQ